MKSHAHLPLAGKKALVTAGPTQEPIDPVRYISNYSSGKQGYAIARALIDAGADVTLISGPVAVAPPKAAQVVNIGTAQDMLAAVKEALPADIVICSAAVCDWQVKELIPQKLKKEKEQDRLHLEFIKTPDILHYVGHSNPRPKLVIGFAAETQDMQTYACQKRIDKNCDWVVANDVSDGKVFGQDVNHAILYGEGFVQEFSLMSKTQLAQNLVDHIIHCIVT